MDNLSVGKVPPSEPDSRPPPITPKGPYDLQATFVCSIRISAKKLYKVLQKRLPHKVDMVNFCLSNSRITISSLLYLSSAKKHITVIVPTNKPVSFGVIPADFGFCLRMMIPGREIHRIVLTYKADEELLILEDGQTKSYLDTVPCTKKGKASISCTKEGNKLDTAPDKRKKPDKRKASIDTVPCTEERNKLDIVPEKEKGNIDTPCTKEGNKLDTAPEKGDKLDTAP